MLTPVSGTKLFRQRDNLPFKKEPNGLISTKLMHLADIFDPLYIEDLADKGPMFLVKQSGSMTVETAKNQNTPSIPKLARQDSVDDFLAGQRVLPEAIHQFMGENVLENQRLCTNSSEGDCPAHPPQVHNDIQQSNQLPPIIPRLKRQDSVDDFLADDRARSRSLTDFINLHEDEKSHSKRLKSTLTFHPAPIQPKPSPESTSHRQTEPNPPSTIAPPDTSSTGTKRRRRKDAGDSGEDAREGRRREQNREAQRRFRERRKYLEFQAFSQRLAAAAAAAAATQPSSYYPAALPSPAFYPTPPLANFPAGFFGVI